MVIFKSFNILLTVSLILPVYVLQGFLISKFWRVGLETRERNIASRFDSWVVLGTASTLSGFLVKSKVPDLDSILISTFSPPVIGRADLILPNRSWVSWSLPASIDPPASTKIKLAVTCGEYKLSN